MFLALVSCVRTLIIRRKYEQIHQREHAEYRLRLEAERRRLTANTYAPTPVKDHTHKGMHEVISAGELVAWLCQCGEQLLMPGYRDDGTWPLGQTAKFDENSVRNDAEFPRGAYKPAQTEIEALLKLPRGADKPTAYSMITAESITADSIEIRPAVPPRPARCRAAGQMYSKDETNLAKHADVTFVPCGTHWHNVSQANGKFFRCKRCGRDCVWLHHAGEYRHIRANPSGDGHMAVPGAEISNSTSFCPGGITQTYEQLANPRTDGKYATKCGTHYHVSDGPAAGSTYLAVRQGDIPAREREFESHMLAQNERLIKALMAPASSFAVTKFLSSVDELQTVALDWERKAKKTQAHLDKVRQESDYLRRQLDSLLKVRNQLSAERTNHKATRQDVDRLISMNKKLAERVRLLQSTPHEESAPYEEYEVNSASSMSPIVRFFSDEMDV
jgi:hypothetical protein